jgi:hypothetical protein
VSTGEPDGATPQPSEEFWLYAGRRPGRCGQPVDASVPNQDGTGDVVLYPTGRGPGAVIGALYPVWVDCHDPGATIRGTPQVHRGKVARTELRVQWAARDIATHTRMSAQRWERTAARHNDLDELTEPLRQVAGKLRTGADRDAFIAHILRRLISTW